MRDISDTTVQLSWSRGFDNHSPIAKYTLQARTPPAGKWKQVRTSKCEAPALRSEKAVGGVRGQGRAWSCKRDTVHTEPAGETHRCESAERAERGARGVP